MPRLPRENLSEFIGVRVTRTEREKIEKEAERQGLSVSDFVRKVIKLYLDGEESLPELNVKKAIALQTLSAFELHYTLMALMLPLIGADGKMHEKIVKIHRKILKELATIVKAKRILENNGWSEFVKFVRGGMRSE